MARTGPRSSHRAVLSMLERVGAPAPEAPTAVDMDVAGVLEAIDCVVACATDDEAAVRGLLDEIADLGLAPKLISGVEAGVEALRDAIFEQLDGGLVVLCVSDSIERVQARRLAEVFNLHRAASQQLLVAGIDRRAPTALLSPVRRATDEYRQRRGAARLGTPGLKGSGDCCAVSGSALSFDDSAPSEDALRDMASVVLDSRLRDEVGTIPETIVFSAVRRSRKRQGVPDADADRPTLELLPVLTPVAEDQDADPDGGDEPASGSPTIEPSRDPSGAVSPRTSRERWIALSGGILMAAVTAMAFWWGELSPDAEPTSMAAPELSLRKAQPISTARASSPSEEVTKPIEAEPLAEPTVLPSPDADLEAVAADGRIYGLAGFFAT